MTIDPDRAAPSAAETRRAEVRAALLDAAERRIAAEGLPGLRARALAQEVGCAVGAIYTAFPDLDALVLEVNLRTLGLFEAALAAGDARALADPAAAADELVRLGCAYLDFARTHRLRWRALFQHRRAAGTRPPDWYVAEQARLFRFVEAPLRVLRPDLPPDPRMLLARSLFSATHGVVALGLDERFMTLSVGILRDQIATVVRAMAAGLRAGEAA